jgi:hypothetical protein
MGKKLENKRNIFNLEAENIFNHNLNPSAMQYLLQEGRLKERRLIIQQYPINNIGSDINCF